MELYFLLQVYMSKLSFSFLVPGPFFSVLTLSKVCFLSLLTLLIVSMES